MRKPKIKLKTKNKKVLKFDTRRVNPQVVEYLNREIEKAKKGETTGICLISFTHDGKVEHRFSEMDYNGLKKLLSELHYLATDVANWCARYDSQSSLMEWFNE